MKVLKQSVPLYQQAYEEIKSSILSGKYKPGSTITVSQLTEEFQISRTPLKEALRQLQNEGLLVLHPMGPKVIQFNRQDISELCYCRLVLEKEMIGLAINEIKDEDLSEIEDVLYNAEKCVKDGKNNELFLEYNSRFHEILMNACPNKMLLQLLEFTRNKLLLYRAISIKDTNDQLRIISEHNEIFKALQKRDKVKAMKAIENHLLTDQSRYNLVVEE